MTEERKVRTRFAPSPTGMLHLGGIRTALYNYLLAKKYNGDFILRIEDTDQTRFVEGAEKYILDTLKWLNIMPNEGAININTKTGEIESYGEYGPYIQSQRKDIYQEYAHELVERGYAYYAFDSNEEIEEMRGKSEEDNVSVTQYDSKRREYMKNSLTLPKEEVEAMIRNGEKYVIRYKTERNSFVNFYDEIRGYIKVDTNTLDDKILLKSDGMATYHLASVVDDHIMNISHIIRGEEWLPSAPLHVELYRAFGWEEDMPKLVHLPVVLKPSGKGKLSKRDADEGGFPIFPLSWYDNKNEKEVIGFREKGFLPEAIINALALLGWNPGNNVELMDEHTLVEMFSIKKISKGGARFDFKKFEWFNHQYIQKKEDLSIYIKRGIDELGIYCEEEKINTIINLIKERCFFTTDIWRKAKLFFLRPEDYCNKILSDEEIKKSIKWIDCFIESSEEKSWEEGILHATCNDLLQQNNLHLKDVMPTFRLILFGETNGPDIIKSIVILGKEETKIRIWLFKKKYLTP